VDPLSFAVDLAAEAAAQLLAHLGDVHSISEKLGMRANLVTEADRASERLIVEHIRKSFPNDGVLAEEGSAYAGTSGNRWVIDPLDGTTNYAHRFPLFAVSIGYEQDGRVVCGAIEAPAIGERFAAERGAGATRNGKRMHVSTIESLGNAMVTTGFQPAIFEHNINNFIALSRLTQAVRRGGAASLDLAFVAAGVFEAFWELDLSPWDVAAGWVIVEEAGGRVTRIDGSPHALDARSVLATNGRLHEPMMEALRRAAAS